MIHLGWIITQITLLIKILMHVYLTNIWHDLYGIFSTLLAEFRRNTAVTEVSVDKTGIWWQVKCVFTWDHCRIHSRQKTCWQLCTEATACSSKGLRQMGHFSPRPAGSVHLSMFLNILEKTVFVHGGGGSRRTTFSPFFSVTFRLLPPYAKTLPVPFFRNKSLKSAILTFTFFFCWKSI